MLLVFAITFNSLSEKFSIFMLCEKEKQYFFYKMSDLGKTNKDYLISFV